MHKLNWRLSAIRLTFKEYFVYIKRNPGLISQIPKRFCEESVLYVSYLLAKIYEMLTGRTKNTYLIKNLRSLTHDMKKANDLYKPSLFWKDLYGQFERVLYTSNIGQFKTQRYNRRFSCPYPNSDIIFQSFIWLYWNNIKQRDTLDLLRTIEEPSLGKGETYTINGKKISYDLLQSLDEFYAIYPHLSKNTNIIICELGAGYGRLGYVFLKAIPSGSYIIVDLPGSLIIAEYYLSKLFPKKDVLRYKDTKKYKSFDRKMLSNYKVVLLAPWQLSLITDKSLDVFINIYSFQEMTMMQIENYFSIIDRKCKGIFYSKQNFVSDNPKDDIRIEMKDYPVKKSWTRIYKRPSTIHQSSFEGLYKVTGS